MALTIKDKLSRAVSGQGGLGFDPLGRDEVRLAQLRVEDIEADSDQPRKDLGDLSELVLSIQEHGLIHPIVVEPLDNKRYRVIAGHRRFAACQEAGLKMLPAIVRTIEEQQKLAFQLTENLTRKDLSPIEEALGYKRLMDEFNFTQDEVAQKVGKKQPTINEVLRLLDLPPVIIENYRTSDNVPKSVLLEIAKQPTSDRQVMLWERAKKGQLTVKQARQEKAPKREAPTPARFEIRTPTAIITVRFHTPGFSREELIQALQDAINLQADESVTNEGTE